MTILILCMFLLRLLLLRLLLLRLLLGLLLGLLLRFARQRLASLASLEDARCDGDEESTHAHDQVSCLLVKL